MRFALDVCELIQQLPQAEPGPTVKRQLAKSSTSVAFHYRASCRARSHTEFTAKIGIVAEEADETAGWFEFIEAARLVASPESQSPHRGGQRADGDRIRIGRHGPV
jgi:four helix bundle protein